MRERISISLPAEIKDDLDRFSDTSFRSRSDIVREALCDYLFNRRSRVLRRGEDPPHHVQENSGA